MISDAMYILFGYLCGSILFARVSGALLEQKDITIGSADGNPGTANAFIYGGFLCGILTLCGDLLKGFLPVYLYLKRMDPISCGMGLAFVIAAPVIGHIFPIFYRFHGGKGIAVTFGSLLGLAPEMRPALLLAFVFLFFSLVVQITPHYDRTIWAYWCAAVCMLLFIRWAEVVAAFLVIAFVVTVNLHFSKEEREKFRVRLLWKH